MGNNDKKERENCVIPSRNQKCNPLESDSTDSSPGILKGLPQIGTPIGVIPSRNQKCNPLESDSTDSSPGILKGLPQIGTPIGVTGTFKKGNDSTEKDPLTNLLDRRTITQQLILMIKKTIEEKPPGLQQDNAEKENDLISRTISLKGEATYPSQNFPRHFIAFMDIDRFFYLNKDYGHAFGDQIIKSIAHIITSRMGEKGIAGRYGGDEFLILWWDMEGEEMLKTMEEILEEIRNIKVPLQAPHSPENPPVSTVSPSPAVSEHSSSPGDSLSSSDFEPLIISDSPPLSIPYPSVSAHTASPCFRVTCSVGIASLTMNQRDPCQILRRADMELYRAKNLGRDRICYSNFIK